MIRHHTRMMISSVILAGAFACAQEDTLSSAEQNATYVAAAEQGGGADTAGVPDESAAPADGDRAPTREEMDVHRDCSLDAVRDRVMAAADTDGDGVISEEERAALEAQFGDRAGRGPRGARGPGGPGGPDGVGRPGPDGVGGPGGGRHRGPMALRRLMWIYDADESGELDDAERAVLEADLEARGAAIEAAMLAEFDADGDGALSDDELAAAREARRAEHEARRAAELVTYDADGDGRLNREEMRAAHEARRADLETQFDADGSGDLDAAERAALREHMRAVVRGEV